MRTRRSGRSPGTGSVAAARNSQGTDAPEGMPGPGSNTSKKTQAKTVSTANTPQSPTSTGASVIRGAKERHNSGLLRSQQHVTTRRRGYWKDCCDQNNARQRFRLYVATRIKGPPLLAMSRWVERSSSSTKQPTTTDKGRCWIPLSQILYIDNCQYLAVVMPWHWARSEFGGRQPSAERRAQAEVTNANEDYPSGLMRPVLNYLPIRLTQCSTQSTVFQIE